MTRTADRRAVQVIDRGRYYTTNQLGQKRSTTPEGFLVCHDVPIARTGVQLYLDEELVGEDGKPLVKGGPDGLVRVERDADQVFREDTLKSFEGKPVTVNHPESFVTPENWRNLTIGFVQNVRRGDGIEDDLVLADLVITDADGIEYVNRDLPEVSAGYEAEYEQLAPGRGRQLNIVGNHVALVERGRAGPRCSIQDGAHAMSKKKRSFWDRLLTAVKAKDAEAVKAEIEDMEGEEDEDEEGKKKPTGDSAVLASINAQLKTLTADVAALKARANDADPDDDDGDDEGKKKTDDEVLDPEPAETNSEAKGKVLSGDSLKAVVARSEILAPGIQIPTGDSAATQVVDALMRNALTTAMASESGKSCVAPFLAGREVKALTGDALAAVFTGAAELARVKNNDAQRGNDRLHTKDFGRATDPQSINERNREFWAKAR